jgi:8-oxo-dGTP diphosphatase
MMEIKRKVLAYITIGKEPDLQVLVFEHKDNPSAGLQVPGGTIEEGELVIDALYREIVEESGITREDLVMKGNVNKTHSNPEKRNTMYERTIFHLDYIGDPIEEWEHRVVGGGSDDGMIFCYRWIPVNELPKLAANQDQAIEML